MKTWNEKYHHNRDVLIEEQLVPTQRTLCVVPIILSAMVIIRHCHSTSSQVLDVGPQTLYKYKNLLY